MSDNNSTIVLAADDKAAKALVDTIRGAVNGASKYAAYVEAHGVTRETVKYHAVALAVFTYPSLPPVQKKDGNRTKFGNAVQAAGNGLRTALGKKDNTTLPDYLAKIIKAADSALEHDIDAGQIADALQKWVADNA